VIKPNSLKIPTSTRAFLKTSLIIVQVIFISACTNDSNNPVSPTQLTPDPFQQNIKLGKGINLGNALEAPNEGDWGFFLEEKYFNIISSAGFNSVRVPIRWSTHALNTAPFTIEESFLNRIEWVVNKSMDNNLAVIINFHHYDELMENPLEQKERFIAIWEQISNRFKNYSNDLFFEILMNLTIT
jgi:endoglucanase